MSNLVIMESPSKAATVKNYLGSNYKVIASKGHVRDLPKSTFGVDIEGGFAAHYINIRGKGDLIREIRKDAKAASKIYLATDPDREGEAIAWHLATVLGLDPAKTCRVTFNEVTKNIVKAAIKEPRAIDMNLVDAQQTRRLLDRIVGYKLSPLLWKNVKNGLSAGRVQSVATRLIVEREESISAFVPEEYWTVCADLDAPGGTLSVRFIGTADGSRMDLTNEADTQRVLDAVSGGTFSVESVKESVRRMQPAPPFTTSTLQQEAFKKLGFQSQRTMRVAQELYEGLNLGPEFGGVQGLITYMRTDSLRVSPEAQAHAGEFIKEKFGERFVPETPRIYKARDGIQDAHEAIRPTDVLLEPYRIRRSMTTDQYRLYKLIWERYVSSQMESAELSTVTVTLCCAGYQFRTSGYTVTFQGYKAVYEETEDKDPTVVPDPADEEVEGLKLPKLKKHMQLKAAEIRPAKHLTEAPPRYTDASLIKVLEERGIGRPSTYNTIIQTISKNYVCREGKSFVPTTLGTVTTKLMKELFPHIVDYTFTAEMENDLDAVEKGEKRMNDVLSGFWQDFEDQLKSAEKQLDKIDITVPPEETDIICDKCGARMVIKTGRFGKFAACPNYPKCRNTKPLDGPKAEEKAEKEKKKEAAPQKEPDEKPELKCELCGADLVIRNGRYGSFYACSRYPACTFTKQKLKELDVPCPLCGSKIVTKYGKNHSVFYSCERYPVCKFSSWDKPISDKCPKCGSVLYLRKNSKNRVFCRNENCGYTGEITPEES